ncbi:TPA: hypothetical protein DIV49_03755 [Candidatus Saccharibacteria bacterium]|nr:hypothetical protein [Candidatus Saccharibacteria bacterium]HRJ90790.1 hypothetical protein [Candidatus Saccharibacteria bacterium]
MFFSKKHESAEQSYADQLRREWNDRKTRLDKFTDEERIAAFSIGFAIDMVDASGKMKRKLDFSEDSVKYIEQILDRLSRSRKKLSNEEVTEVARKASSYIGEVMRRFHGGEWKLEGSIPQAGVVMLVNGMEAYIFQKVGNRLVNGPEDNVWDFYNVCIGNVKMMTAQAQNYLDKYKKS